MLIQTYLGPIPIDCDCPPVLYCNFPEYLSNPSLHFPHSFGYSLPGLLEFVLLLLDKFQGVILLQSFPGPHMALPSMKRGISGFF
jgi:hypothetical protein